MAAKIYRKSKTIHKEHLSRHLLQINWKLTNTLGTGVGVVCGGRKTHSSFERQSSTSFRVHQVL